MSSALAIAAVTAVLKDLLINGLIDRDLVSSVGDVTVTALAPDRIEIGADEASQLNVFMYNAMPNAGWRNYGLPSRADNGDRVSNPPLALDLYYIISAYGAKDFHSEILLGYAMQLLHETPVLSRAAIRVALSPTPVSGGGGLPPTLEALASSNLADQIEQIRIAPVTMNAEEASRLWTAFGAKYRPSACYRVSVILIESTLPARSPLPVLMRGENDRGVLVQPSLDPPFPTLANATPPNEQTAARLNETVTLRGFHLDGEAGDTIAIFMAHPRLTVPLEITPIGVGSANELQFQIPNDSPNVPAGLYAVSVGFIKGGKLYRTTNELGLALAPDNPTLAPASPIPRDVGGNITITATVSPSVWNGQRVSLMLGGREVYAQPFAAAKTNTLTFLFKAIPPDDYFVRLRVDGVESILIDRTVTPPVFDPTQQITVT